MAVVRSVRRVEVKKQRQLNLYNGRGFMEGGRNDVSREYRAGVPVAPCVVIFH